MRQGAEAPGISRRDPRGNPDLQYVAGTRRRPPGQRLPEDRDERRERARLPPERQEDRGRQTAAQPGHAAPVHRSHREGGHQGLLHRDRDRHHLRLQPAHRRLEGLPGHEQVQGQPGCPGQGRLDRPEQLPPDRSGQGRRDLWRLGPDRKGSHNRHRQPSGTSPTPTSTGGWACRKATRPRRAASRRCSNT